GLPYGDQALFARRTALEAAGGVPPVALLEDLDLVRALQRQGRVVRVPLPVVTSARRYLRHGVLRVWWRNALTLAGWRLGLDRGRLAAWYRRRARRPRRSRRPRRVRAGSAACSATCAATAAATSSGRSSPSATPPCSPPCRCWWRGRCARSRRADRSRRWRSAAGGSGASP